MDLLVQHRRWLCRFELRQAVEAAVIDGELCAWVAWPYVDLDAPASSGELRILAIARSLGGVASERSLGDLLTSLDETNTARVLRAVSIACGGRRHDPLQHRLRARRGRRDRRRPRPQTPRAGAGVGAHPVLAGRARRAGHAGVDGAGLVAAPPPPQDHRLRGLPAPLGVLGVVAVAVGCRQSGPGPGG